jgi:hypothetical protein
MKKTLCALAASTFLLTQADIIGRLRSAQEAERDAYAQAWSEPVRWVPATILPGTYDVDGFFRQYCIGQSKADWAYRNRVIERNPANFRIQRETPYDNDTAPTLYPGDIQMINRCNE